MFDAGRRPTGRLFYWLLTGVIAASGFGAWVYGAAVPQTGPATTTIADTVYLADGTTASGSLIITWPAFVTASGAAVAGGATSTTLGANGALSVALVPNAGATPAGVYYTVVYQIGPGEVKTEYWVVPTTSPVNLAGVRTTPGSGAAAQPVSMQYVDTQLAGVVHLGGTETITGTKTFAASPTVPTPTSSGAIANKGYVDQSVSNVGSGSYLATAGGTMTGPITLPANPAAPLQAATKQYVDLGLTSKADLIAGLVPASELGTGTASAGNCLLGNGTWGGCGAGNISTNPGAGVSQNITQTAGTQFSTNNLAGIPFVVASYNWSQSPADSLATAGNKTIHLTPCPAGVDTSNNTSAQYAVYIAGTGTAEAAPVTGGTCTSGASTGTILVTTANAHSAGYTVGAANGGNQEAINVAAGSGLTHAVIQEVPTGGANTANYNIYWPVFLKAAKSILNGYGAQWACYTRSTCLMVGTYAGGGNASTVEGLEFQSAVNVTGAHIASVSAAAGTYTITTSTAHNLVSGDWAILYYTTPVQQQEARVQVLATGLTATQFEYVLGGTTFSSSAGFGWVAIENTAIEAETDGARLQDIKFNAGLNGGLFHEGVVVGNDQSFKIDGMTNEGTGQGFRCDQYFCSNMVYLRGDQGAAPVGYLHHLEASMQCSGNGVRDVGGNSLDVQDSVIQGVNQYAIYYTGGLQPWTVNNVYNESGLCYNPFYPGSQAAIAGYIDNNQPLTVVGSAPIGGVFPQFVSGGANQRNYYVIPQDGNLGTGPMMFIGTAMPATGSTSIPLYWPNPDLVGAGTRTFDILVTTGTTQTSAPYTGNAFSIVTGVSGNCNSSGICTYTDTQGAATAYSVANAGWTPTLPFWPGSIILGNGASAYIDQCGQASSIISTSYLPKVFCKRGVLAGQPYSYSPYWGVFSTGDSGGNGNKNVGAQVLQIGPASGSWTSGISGGLNLNPGPGATVLPRQIITTMDGSPQQTFATPGYVRAGSAKDSFIGTDSASLVGSQDQTYGAPAGHFFYVNDPGTSGTTWLEGLTASLKTFQVPVQFNAGVTLAGSGGITATSGTFSGNLTVNGQLNVAGPWMVSSPIPGTAMAAAGAGMSSVGISNDGNFYISANAGTPQKVATTATSSYFTNLFQEDANDLGEYNGTTAQGLHVYGTYTNASNYERTGLGWDATDGYFVLKNENAGTGSQRGIGFWIGSGVRWAIDTLSTLKPGSNNSFNIGSTTYAPQTIYAATSFDTLTQGRQNFELCNDATTGTSLNFLAVYNGATPACALKAASTSTDGVIGIVSNGSGTSGNAVITYRGYVPCSFDGSTVAGDFVVASTTNAGDCHDAGATRPAGVQVLGRVESTNTGIGTYAVRVSLDAPAGGGGSMVYPSAGVALSTGSAWNSSIPNPSSTQAYTLGWTGSAVAYTPNGMPSRTFTTGSTDTLLAGDNGHFVVYNNGSTAVALTVPQAGTTGFANNYTAVMRNTGTANVNLTTTTSTINGSGQTAAMYPGTSCTLTSPDNANWTFVCVPLLSSTGSLQANTSGSAAGLSANIAESQVTNLTTDLGNRVPTSTTVNGHALSSSVTVSASDLTTGTLPHAQLPALVSGDIPNNAANTTGTAANLSGTPGLPNGTTATTQAAGDNSTKVATTAYVRAEMNALAWSCPISGFTSTVSSCGWTVPAGITITGFDLYAGTAATSCTTYPVVEIYDGTGSAEVGSFAITMTSGTNGYTQVTGSTAFTSGHVLRIKTATAGAGCTGPSNVVATVSYQMTN